MVRLSASTIGRAASRFALHALVALPLAVQQPSLTVADVFKPPAWVTTENGAMLKRQSDENTRIPDQNKAAKRIFDQAVELAGKSIDESEQTRDDTKLANAEDKFTLVVDELAPNYAYAYTNRANVRVARGDLVNAITDYGKALELAPLASDVWVTYLNRGSTLLAINRADLALRDLQRAVELSSSDRYALLGRGGALHALGRYQEANVDYAAVLEKYPADVQAWWLRYALDLAEVGRRPEALGLVRRLAAKFDIEPETTLGVCSLLWGDGTTAERDEALRRWNNAPATTKRAILKYDVGMRQWPPGATAVSKEFRAAVPPPPPEPQAQPTATPPASADTAAPTAPSEARAPAPALPAEVAGGAVAAP